MPVYVGDRKQCPVCQAPLNAHGDDLSPGEVREPGPGDCTVCMYCTAFLQFTDDMALHSLTSVEFSRLDPDIQVGMMMIWRRINLYREHKRDH